MERGGKRNDEWWMADVDLSISLKLRSDPRRLDPFAEAVQPFLVSLLRSVYQISPDMQEKVSKV